MAIHLRQPVPLARRAAALAAAISACALTLPAPRTHAQEADAQIRYINRELSFDDVEVATVTRWLGRAGIELPVTVDGRVSGTLSVGVPSGALREARAWRFRGQFTSPRLTVADFALEQVTVALAYRDGSLFLDQLRLDVPPPPGDAGARRGVVAGSAQMQLVPRGQFTAALDVENLPLEQALARIAAAQPARGRFTGRLEASVPVNDITRLGAWRVRGPLALADFSLRGSPPAEAFVEVVLDSGTVVAHEFQFRLAGNTVTGSASLAVREPLAWVAAARVTAPDIPAALALAQQLAPSPALAEVRAAVQRGALTADVDGRGTLLPVTAQATGQIMLERVGLTPPESIAARLPLRPLAVDALGFRYAVDAQAVRVTDLSATVAGAHVPGAAARAQLTGAATLPLSDGDIAAEVQWSNLRVAEILDLEQLSPGVAAGASGGTLAATIPRRAASDPAGWQVDASATLSSVAYQGWTVADIRTGELRLRNGQLAAPEFRFNVGGNPAVVALNLGVRAPYGIGAAVDIPRVDLALLRRAPQFAGAAQRLSGAVSASGSVSGTLAPLALAGRGRVAGRAITFDGHRLDAISADVVLAREAATLSNIEAAAYGGTARGEATIPLDSSTPGAASLAWSRLDLGAAVARLPLDPIAIGGPSDGSAAVQIPAGALADPTRWSGSASVRVAQLRVYAFEASEVTADPIALNNGVLTAPAITAAMDGQPLKADLRLQLDPMQLTVGVVASRFQASRLAGLPYLEALGGELAGLADTDSRLVLNFNPLTVDVSGTVALEVVSYQRFQLDRLRARYHLTPQSLAVSELEASLYGGTISGGAVVPFDEATAGSAAVAWAEIEVGQIITQVLRPPAPLAGATSGRATIAMPPGQLAAPGAWTAQARVELPGLRAAGRPLASLTAELAQRERQLSYSAQGTLARGRLSLQGSRNPALPAAGLPALGSAQLSLRGAGLDAIQQALADPSDAGAALTGAINLEAVTRATADSWSWQLAASTGPVTAGAQSLTPGVVLRASGDAQSVRLQQTSGGFAGGELSGRGEWGFGPRAKRNFRVRLRDASLASLQALASPDSDAAATGNVDLDLRIRPGSTWRVQATALATRATVGGVAVQNFSVPVLIEWSPTSGQLWLNTTSTQLSLAGGRMSGRLTARYSTAWHADGHFRFYRVDAATLAGSGYASGRLSGTLDLRGRNARSINDLEATLLADLEGAQSRGVPVLDQIRTAVPGAGLSGATQFNEGRVEARLAGGVVRLDRLSLANPRLQIYITGNITLGGRLNLDATVATGQAANPTLANALLVDLLAVPAAPVALVLRANEFLSDRVVQLRIVGTVSRPTIRLRAFETLGAEAVRFFLRQSTAGVLGGSAAGAGAASK